MGDRIFSFFLESICSMAGVGLAMVGEGGLLPFTSSLLPLACWDRDDAARTSFSGSVERTRAQLKSFTFLVVLVDLTKITYENYWHITYTKLNCILNLQNTTWLGTHLLGFSSSASVDTHIFLATSSTTSSERRFDAVFFAGFTGLDPFTTSSKNREPFGDDGSPFLRISRQCA